MLEGIIYSLYGVLTALEEVTGPAKSIQVSGGFARSFLWRQMLADMFNRTVIIPDNPEGSCFGAAVLGLYALGRISDLEQVNDMLCKTHSHQPALENVERYQSVLPV